MTTAFDSPDSLPDMLPVEAGRMTSRVLLRAGGGSVTAFAFAAGQGLAEHATPREALFVVTDGEARLTVGGAAHLRAAGQMLHFPAGAPHAVEALTDMHALLILLDP